MPDNSFTSISLLKGIRGFVGAGAHLFFVGFFLEGLTFGLQQWISFPFSMSVAMKIVTTLPCIAVCLFGVIWFNCTLNLIKIQLLNGKKELITHGPFSYVRHPLYATLIITMPPLAIIWRSDFIFVVPWVLILIISHYVVRLEERGLIKIFGDEYKRYQRHVPTLLPFKGSGGQRYRPIRS